MQTSYGVNQYFANDWYAWSIWTLINDIVFELFQKPFLVVIRLQGN